MKQTCCNKTQMDENSRRRISSTLLPFCDKQNILKTDIKSSIPEWITLFSLFIFLTLLLPLDSISQTSRNISGKVKSKSGELLPGAAVNVKGTTIGTVTNSNGEYNLTIKNEDATIVFSFVGFISLEINPKGFLSGEF